MNPSPTIVMKDAGQIIAPQNVVEIQQEEIEQSANGQDFTMLHQISEYAEQPSEDPTMQEGHMPPGTVSYEVQMQENGEVSQPVDVQLITETKDFHVVKDSTDVMNDAIEVIIATSLESALDQENMQSYDEMEDSKDMEDDSRICEVRVELLNEEFVQDMENIDLFVVYTCKRCGFGDQNIAQTINHSRMCVHQAEMDEVNAKFMKVMNLFKSFSHRSVPLKNCIAPAAAQKKTIKIENEKQFKVEKEEIKTISEDFTDDDIGKIVEICKKQVKSVPKVTESVENEPRKWFCEECPATIIFSDIEFRLHKDSHSNESNMKKFICKECKLSEDRRRKLLECDDWNTMKTHLTTIHQIDMELECTICPQKLANHQKYHKHVRSHKQTCRFRLCNFTTTSHKTLLAHERCHSDKDNSLFQCPECNWISEGDKSKWNIMHSHLTRIHPGFIEPLYKCKLCSKEFSEIRRFKTHMTMCSMLENSCRPTCVVCGKMVMATELEQHVIKHSKSRHWYLKMLEVLSGEISRSNSALITMDLEGEDSVESEKTVNEQGDHEQSEAEEQNEDQHETRKSQSPQKNKRVLVSSGLLKEKCVHCYKKFATTQRLQRHIMRSHPDGGASRTVCDTCGRSFRNKEQWRNHNRQVHLGVKRKPNKANVHGKTGASRVYMCEICMYATPSMARLKNHYSTVHMGVFPFHCEKCPYKTNEQSDMRRHMLKHTGQKPYKCEHCEYKTTQRWILVNHCQRVHKVALPKRSLNTLGCEWSMKRMHGKASKIKNLPSSEEIKQEEEAVQYILDSEAVGQVQPDDEDARIQDAQGNTVDFSNGEVVVEIDEGTLNHDGNGMTITAEAAHLLANMASRGQASIAVQEAEEIVQDGGETRAYITGEDGGVVMIELQSKGDGPVMTEMEEVQL